MLRVAPRPPVVRSFAPSTGGYDSSDRKRSATSSPALVLLLLLSDKSFSAKEESFILSDSNIFQEWKHLVPPLGASRPSLGSDSSLRGDFEIPPLGFFCPNGGGSDSSHQYGTLFEAFFLAIITYYWVGLWWRFLSKEV